MLTADAVAPIEPAKLNHWIAILAASGEEVRVWANALCAAEEPSFLRNLIEHFSAVSVPDAVASLKFQFHRARGNSARAAKSCFECARTHEGACGAKVPSKSEVLR